MLGGVAAATQHFQIPLPLFFQPDVGSVVDLEPTGTTTGHASPARTLKRTFPALTPFVRLEVFAVFALGALAPVREFGIVLVLNAAIGMYDLDDAHFIGTVGTSGRPFRFQERTSASCPRWSCSAAWTFLTA